MFKKRHLSDHYHSSLIIFINALILISNASIVSCQEYNTLTNANAKGTYTLIAPAKLRPNSKYQVSTSLHPTAEESILFDLKVSISGDDQYHAANTSALLRPGETRILNFEIGSWKKGNKCQLTLVGKGKDTTIRNKADLEFEPKSCSIFIQTDKAIYKPGQTILFRLILVNSALLPISNGTFDLFILDSQKNRIKQWTQQKATKGIYSNELKISPNPLYGDWTISVNYLGQEFSKTITIAEYVLPSFDVDLEIPSYTTINQPIILATIRAKYSFDKPVNSAEAELIILPKSNYYSSKIKPLTMLTIKRTLENGSISIPINLEKDLNLKVNQISNQEFDFQVKVEDTQTGKKINKTKTLKLYDKEIEVIPLIETKTFKPGLPINIQFKVAYQDNTPVKNTNDVLKLKYGFGYNDEDLTKELNLIPRNGIADATIYTPRNISFNCIILEGKYKNHTYQFGCLESMQTYSQVYLQITSNDLKNGFIPKVGQNLNFIVNCSEKIDHLVYHVISRGDIVLSKSINFSGSKEREKSIYNIDFDVTSAMSPKARLIAYYIRSENKEVIADLIKFNVDDIFKTEVTINLSERRTKPKSNVKISVKTKPNAFIGLLAVDQSVNQIKGNNDITQQEVVKELETYSNVIKPANWYRTRRSLELDTLLTSSDVFSNSGLILLTDGNVQSSTPNSFYRVNDGLFYSGIDDYDYKFGNADLIKNLKDEKTKDLNKLSVRKYFPETWLFASKIADYNGEAVFESKTPDSITSWIISAFSMDEFNGLGIASSNANLTVFRKFFIKLNLPYSVIRDEIISVQILAFNYDNKPIESEITLSNEDKHFNFSIAINNNGQQNDEQQLNNKAYAYKSRKIIIPPNDSITVSFLITSNKVGAINLKVKATSPIASDTVIRTLLVKPEGETQYRNEARLIDLERKKEFFERINISLPNTPIAGSGFLTVSLVGDLIGSNLNNILRGDLIRLPYGCGEQNMINFVPNILILDYLKRAKKLPLDLEKKIVNFIEVGYQTELKFKRNDGSFSAFETDKEGSTWLTAYVLKSFLMAKSHLPIIDDNVTNQAANWLIQRQVSDGSFDEPGEVHYKQIQGSSANGQATLTAFVLIALYQKKELAQLYQGQINRAVTYLSRQVQNDYARSTHELAIITYALHLANSEYKHQAFNKFWQLRYEGERNQIHWPNNISNIILKDRLNGKQSDHFYLPNPIDIETAAYGLLILFHRSDIKQALPVMNYLISKQNSKGGFSSTSDTVLALQALAQMSSKMNSNQHNVSCKIKFGYNKKLQVQSKNLKGNRSEILEKQNKKSDNQEIEIRLNSKGLESDQFELSESDLSYTEHLAEKQELWISNTHENYKNRKLVQKIPDYVEVEAIGNGTGVLHISWQYNLNTETEESPFYLETKIDNSTDDQMNVDVCSYYKVGNQTNMAILEVSLPSGWKMNDHEMLMYNMDDVSKRVKKIETNNADTNIIFYFDRIKNDETCVRVPAQRTTKIANNKQVAVKLYDYYNKIETARSFYEPLQLKPCDICEKNDCDASCGKGDYQENEISDNQFLKDASAGSSVPCHFNFYILLIFISLIYFQVILKD